MTLVEETPKKWWKISLREELPHEFYGKI